jgi:hypothetical protein
METLATLLPNARLALVEGGHMIAPSDPQVAGFIQETLAAAPTGPTMTPSAHG